MLALPAASFSDLTASCASQHPGDWLKKVLNAQHLTLSLEERSVTNQTFTAPLLRTAALQVDFAFASCRILAWWRIVASSTLLINCVDRVMWAAQVAATLPVFAILDPQHRPGPAAHYEACIDVTSSWVDAFVTDRQLGWLGNFAATLAAMARQPLSGMDPCMMLQLMLGA